MIFPSTAIGSRVYPHGLAALLNSNYQEKGVMPLASKTVNTVQRRRDKTILTPGIFMETAVDGVVDGIGYPTGSLMSESAKLALNTAAFAMPST
jgi:hypothetical protein